MQNSPVGRQAGNRRFPPDFEHAGSILRETHRDLVSKQQIAKVDGIELIRIKREQAKQTLCFSSRPFVLCGLPVRRLPKGQLLYQRRNGMFVLQVTGLRIPAKANAVSEGKPNGVPG